MTLDRVAQIALTFFGALMLVLLVLGLSVSCRETSAGSLATLTPAADVLVATSAASPTPLNGNVATATPPGMAVSANTATPTTQPGVTQPDATQPDATAAPGSTAVPGSTLPGATVTSPTGSGGMVPGATARHAVSRGEWVLQIARCYGVTYQSVLTANYLPNPDFILPGQILTIPNIGSIGKIVGPPCVVSYTVATGDTWESLSARYGTTTAILQRANPGPLTVGRSIWVPRVP